MKKMGDIFRRHPENFVPDQETAFSKVASGCCAYIMMYIQKKGFFLISGEKYLIV